MARPTPLREIAALFPPLGTTAFGSPAAHIALMADEVDGSRCLQLGRSALVDPATLVIAAVALLVLVRHRVRSTWLLLAGEIAGILISGGLSIDAAPDRQ